MKKQKLFWLFISSSIFLHACNTLPTQESETPTLLFTQNDVIKAHTFIVVADTPEKQTQGLMYQTNLSSLCKQTGNCGMLFVFNTEDQHAFWMKNTPLPLDIIFISKDLIVVDIIPAEPCTREPCKSYIPQTKAQYALEITKGFAEQHHISIGDHVQTSVL